MSGTNLYSSEHLEVQRLAQGHFMCVFLSFSLSLSLFSPNSFFISLSHSLYFSLFLCVRVSLSPPLSPPTHEPKIVINLECLGLAQCRPVIVQGNTHATIDRFQDNRYLGQIAREEEEIAGLIDSRLNRYIRMHDRRMHQKKKCFFYHEEQEKRKDFGQTIFVYEEFK